MSQKAIVQNEVGVPLVAITRPIPTATPGHILVKITSVGLNPHDQKSRDTGLFTKDALPGAILANDVAGEVIALGPSGTGSWKIGDHAVAQTNLFAGPDHGGLQQYCLLDCTYASKIPSNVSDDQAATIPVNVIAPFITLFTANGFGWPIPGTDAAKGFDYSAQTLLIIGGGANTGKFMTQFAKWAGVGTIIAVAGPKNETELKKYGATHIIDRHSSSALEEIRAITGDELTCVFDCVNEGDLTFDVSALSNTRNGLVACLIPGKADEAKVVGEKKGGYDCRHQLGLSWAHPEAAKFFWGHMEGWLKDGVITPGSFEVYEGLDADKINAVYDNYRDGKAQGKVHIRP